MKTDDSFKKPGAIPFKWEIRPGVPKIQDPQPLPEIQEPLNDHCFEFEFQEVHKRKHHVQRKKQHSPTRIRDDPFMKNPPKLKPPPAGLYFQPPLVTRTPSFRSSSSSRSHRFGLTSRTGLARPDLVDSVGCFPSLSPRRRIGNRNGDQRLEPEYSSDLEFSARWSISSRKSVSPLSSSFASCRSSPRPVSDAEWATFGLF